MSSDTQADLQVERMLHTAERMRAEFDRSFTEPVSLGATGARDFVLVMSGGQQWALPLHGLRGIEHDRPLIPVPSSRASMVGVAGVGSMAVPVFDLAALARAGQSKPAASAGKRVVFALVEFDAEASRQAQAGTGQLVGIAFDRLLQFARVPAEAVLRPAGQGSGRPTLQHEEELYSIVEAEELLRQILPGASVSLQPALGGSTEKASGPREHRGYGDPTK